MAAAIAWVQNTAPQNQWVKGLVPGAAALGGSEPFRVWVRRQRKLKAVTRFIFG